MVGKKAVQIGDNFISVDKEGKVKIGGSPAPSKTRR